MARNKRVDWTILADPMAATDLVLEAARGMKFDARIESDGHVVVEAPFSLRNNSWAGKYTGAVSADGDGTVVSWTVEGQGSNQQRNLEKMAEKLPNGVLASSGRPVVLVTGDGQRADTGYRQKYGIPEEAVLAAGVGGYCSFDGQFLTIQHVGLLGRLTVGKGVKRLPVRSIAAVQVKPAGALVNGFIQFTIPGGNEVRSEFGRQTRDAASDENSIVFNLSQQAAFLAFRDALEAAIVSRENPAQAPTSAGVAPSQSIIDQIGQLASLRDAGALTNEEFEVKKAQLLERI